MTALSMKCHLSLCDYIGASTKYTNNSLLRKPRILLCFFAFLVFFGFWVFFLFLFFFLLRAALVLLSSVLAFLIHSMMGQAEFKILILWQKHLEQQEEGQISAEPHEKLVLFSVMSCTGG